MSKIAEGYKQTEVGIIPREWVIKPLGEVVDFLDGQRRPIKDSDRAKMRGQYPYYGASGVIDFVNNYIFDEELILLGEDGENILSRNVRLAFKISGKIWVNNHAHVLKPKEGFDINYLTEKLESINYEQYNTGTAQPKLNQNTCWTIPVSLPPTKAEQAAIATALNDADALITQLEKLIAKKRNIKQGAMQELLRPKEGWEVKQLKDIAQFTNGKAHEQFIDDNGDYIVVNSKFISTEGEVYKNSNVALSPLNKGYIAMVMSDIPNGKALAKCFLVKQNDRYTLNQRICSIKSEECNNDFLYWILNRNKYFLAFDSGTGQTNLKKQEVLECPMPLPPTIEEQENIAQILSDMDAEIEALEKKLEKYKMLKQGMMQNLLTGRVRLI